MEKCNKSKLTAEQSEFVAKNHNLIFSYARLNNLSIDEYYGLLAIGLCKAAKIYDPSKGFAFSPLAYRCMRNECYRYNTRKINLKSIPPDCIISYNQPMKSGDETIEILDSLSASRDCSVSIDKTAVEVREFINTLPEKYRPVIIKMIEGKRATEVATELGCTKQNVYRILENIRNSWKTYNIKPLFYS